MRPAVPVGEAWGFRWQAWDHKEGWAAGGSSTRARLARPCCTLRYSWAWGSGGAPAWKLLEACSITLACVLRLDGLQLHTLAQQERVLW